MVFFSLSPPRKTQVERRCSSGSLRRRSGALRKVAAHVSPRAKEGSIAEAFGFEPEVEGVMETTDALLFSGEPIHYITDRAVGAVREKLDSWKPSGRWQRCVRFDVGDKEEDRPEPKRNRCRADACDDLESMVAAYEAKRQELEEPLETERDAAAADEDASERIDFASDAEQVDGAPSVGRSRVDAGDEAHEHSTPRSMPFEAWATDSASCEAPVVDELAPAEPEPVAEVCMLTGRGSRRVHFDEATVKEEVTPFVGARPRANTVFDLDAWLTGETA